MLTRSSHNSSTFSQLQLRPITFPFISSLMEGLSIVEMNNNEEEQEEEEGKKSKKSCLDIVALLNLDNECCESEEGAESHASSLESLLPLQGSHSPSPSQSHSFSGSTSCSESSFEMASTSSVSDDDHPLPPPTSFSCHTLHERGEKKRVASSGNEEIDKEIQSLPQLDFDALQRNLTEQLARSKEDERKRLSEEVRRRLALPIENSPLNPSPSIKRTFKPSFTNKRLQPTAQLQVCYMNEMSEWSESEDESPMRSMPSSKSVPDFKEAAIRARHLRKLAMEGQRLTPGEREDVLRAETLAVQAAAAREGRRTVEELKESRRGTEGKSRLARHILSRMNTAQLKGILEGIEDKIEATNAQLVTLLMARDTLHMERDSLLVDIGDILQGHRSKQINIRQLLQLQDTSPTVEHDISTPT